MYNDYAAESMMELRRFCELSDLNSIIRASPKHKLLII